MPLAPKEARRRRWIGAVLCAVAAMFVIVIAGALVVRPFLRRAQGWFGAADYPSLAATGGWARYGLPLTLPPGATGVIIYAPASAPSLLPAPDQYVEVRFLLAPAQAAALLNSALGSAIQPTSNVSYSFTLDRLQTAGDGDADTPLGPGFQHAILRNPSGLNVGGVSIDPIGGEVVYWVFEH